MAKRDIPKKPVPNPKASIGTKDIPIKGVTVQTALIAVIAITFIAFLPTFSNGFVFWDDPQYVLHNTLMGAPLKVIFGIPSGYYMWNYHPLTILVYSFEHKFFGADMMGYHAISLLLHLLNSVLVFNFIYYLLGKKNIMIPMITALLFGVHPMHVESVAWASELKDVLYTFFFLAALISYVFYLQKGRQIKYLLYALILFILSLISKGQAVTLPLSFLLIDYFLKRKPDMKMAADKLVFFGLSLVFGIIAVKAQDNSIVIHDASQFFQDFFFGFYALCIYLFKFVLPINLSGLYPYPNPFNTNDTVPVMVYAAPVIIFVLLFITVRLFRKDRFVMFGVLFFLANIFTVVKFIPVSEAIAADRYSYIPYIGLFFAIGYGFNKLLNNSSFKPNKKVLQYAGIALLLVLSTMTWARTMVWKDSFSFWGDVIQKDPTYWHPYECLGEAYLDKLDYPNAIKCFQQSIDRDKFGQNATNSSRLNLGLCYFRTKDYSDALKTYNDLIARSPDITNAYHQRGMVYQFETPAQPELALADYNKAIQLSPNDPEAYLSRGSLYVDQLAKYDLGIADFNKTLEMDPGNSDAVINKGVANYKQGNYDEALNNYNQELGKVQDNGRVYFLEALAYAGKKEFTKALENAEQAQKSGTSIDAGLMQQWKAGK
jgi:protein O-mannosyl-transferase